MEKFEALGFTAVITKDKLKIEIPIKNLVEGFNDSPNNFSEAVVKRGYRNEFAKYVAKNLIDGSNPDTGDNPIMEALENVFDELFEGDAEFIKYEEDEDY